MEKEEVDHICEIKVMQQLQFATLYFEVHRSCLGEVSSGV